MRAIGLVSLSLALLSCADAVDVPACGGDDTSEVCQVFAIVNEERADAGLSPYEWNTELAIAAQLHADDMDEQGYFDHVSLDGRSFSDRAGEAGYDAFATGENIASGQRSPEQVMQSWMASSGHRGNILSIRSNEVGIGLRNFKWVQVFGQRAM